MTRLHDITFEGGSLTGAQGADSAQGSLTLDSSSTVKGTYCSRAQAAGDFSRDDNTASNSHYVSALIKITTLPASSQGRVLFIRNATTILCSLRITSAGKVQLRNSANTQIGSDSTKTLSTGTIYRLGLRYTKGTGSDAILEAYVVDDGAAWGSPFASTTTDINTIQVDRVEAGCASGGTAMDIFFDNIRIDDAAMPTDDIAGGTTFNQSVNASSSSTFTLVNSVNKSVTATEGNSFSLVKSVNKPISITESNSVSITRSVGKIVTSSASNSVNVLKSAAKIISATSSNSVSISAGLAFLKEISISVSSTASLSRAVNKAISVSIASTISIPRQINKIISITSSVTARVTKLLQQVINVTASTSVSIAAQLTGVVFATFRKSIESIGLAVRNSRTLVYIQTTINSLSISNNEDAAGITNSNEDDITMKGSDNGEL